MPLEGLIVLELARLLPGPLAGVVLRDFGATVIKLEVLPKGDYLRGTDLFELINRGKRSVAVQPEVLLPVLEAFLPQVDIVIMNYRKETQHELGLEPDYLARKFPRLISVNIEGYSDGRPGHDLNFLAESGVLDRLRLSPDGPPIIPAFLFGDILGGTATALIRLLVALYQRTQTGKGSYIHLAIREEMLRWSLISAHLHRASGGNPPLPSQDLFSGVMPSYRVYATRDNRYIAVASLEEKFWKEFCEFLGREDLLPYGWSVGDPYPHRELENIFRQRSWQEWREALEGNQFCVSPVLTFQEAISETWAKGVWQGDFLTFSQGLSSAPAPSLGADTEWAKEQFALPL
ncbi:MAG: CaiB/BaiF CoA-transferase family protein [Bacteroidia bacterium]|nr:CoA transferase [Bacteroidia bacterium]MDW8134893.1 CaiB/BaiF CoA-transferase family protein [Bacteroidia bacterium]